MRDGGGACSGQGGGGAWAAAACGAAACCGVLRRLARRWRRVGHHGQAGGVWGVQRRTDTAGLYRDV
jgi:hypothetical protein